MSYVYQPDRGDYFESYLPQIGTSTHYDFYQAPTEPGEPLIPYGWRPDWSRATTGGWPTMATVPFTHATATQMTMSGMAQAAEQMAATQPHARITHPHLSQTLQLPINATAPSVQLASLTSTAAAAAALPAPRFTAAPLTYRLPKPEVDPPKLSLPPTAPRSVAKSARKEAAKPFPCHICGKSFSQAANLTAHKRVHTGEKPFCCSVCQRPFSQSSSLVTHKRTHTGERPYPCPHCDKAFTDSSTLTKHLRTHTGLKPYACPMCLMRFTQSGNLHRHMKTHRASK